MDAVPIRAVAVLMAALLGACARPVTVEPPQPLSAQADAACIEFTAALPAALDTAGERRDVTPPSDLTAAYGDPPVAIRCGVDRPAALGPESTLVTVEGIDWFPEELTHGWRMTTVEGLALVEVTVPVEQGPAPSVAVDLAPVIEATIPLESATATAAPSPGAARLGSGGR